MPVNIVKNLFLIANDVGCWISVLCNKLMTKRKLQTQQISPFMNCDYFVHDRDCVYVLSVFEVKLQNNTYRVLRHVGPRAPLWHHGAQTPTFRRPAQVQSVPTLCWRSPVSRRPSRRSVSVLCVFLRSDYLTLALSSTWTTVSEEELSRKKFIYMYFSLTCKKYYID